MINFIVGVIFGFMLWVLFSYFMSKVEEDEEKKQRRLMREEYVRMERKYVRNYGRKVRSRG